MTNCLVTGGAGFIGCAISSALAQQFDKVIALDNLHPQVHKTSERPSALDDNVELVVGDITDQALWGSLLARFQPDVVIHLAAETGTGQSLTEATRHAHVNVTGTTRMLDALAARGIVPTRFVLSSSRAVYGEGAWCDSNGNVSYPGQRSDSMLESQTWDFPGLQALPFCADTTQTKPTSIYGATKLAQEHILKAWALSFGSSANIVRLQNVYGPGQSLSNPYTGIVSLFARLAKEGRSIPVYEDGKMLRDFVFIEDVARAILAAATTVRTDVLADIGTGVSTNIWSIARIAAQIYGAPDPHVTSQYRNGDVRHAACKVDLAAEQLNWKPETSAEDGIRLLCHWIDNGNKRADA
ncbi:dTDP-L-rhamnose 4-epimerase [Rhodanobacter sp. ANJX3]|uniref:NAD-dependent epimerase/dehydratase family protein n=1 Tax=unclassified Rhodanobacter TaxID=2621553 RepID=UPI0015CE8605|nr:MULTISPECIES: NAD-dependent epimerase/dehydratase family protein [unclassified Rhodanobacter]MBB5360833.1 dTDP-L-rhamnose 4-epimerase [Rhodanobacter sp. ANJX3]NYE30214.1 dTDP-L-rhamnose 4-epimerase [Rhodanobacter sp. K2T2]